MVLEKKFEAPFNKRPRDGPLLKINEQLYRRIKDLEK